MLHNRQANRKFSILLLAMLFYLSYNFRQVQFSFYFFVAIFSPFGEMSCSLTWEKCNINMEQILLFSFLVRYTTKIMKVKLLVDHRTAVNGLQLIHAATMYWDVTGRGSWRVDFVAKSRVECILCRLIFKTASLTGRGHFTLSITIHSVGQ